MGHCEEGGKHFGSRRTKLGGPAGFRKVVYRTGQMAIIKVKTGVGGGEKRQTTQNRKGVRGLGLLEVGKVFDG